MGTPSRADEALIDISAATDAVGELTWPDQSSADRIGLEVEAFPIVVVGGRPGPRLPLHGPRGVIDVMDGSSAPGGPIGPRSGDSPVYPTMSDGRITFEPGGQIEHSSAAHADTVGLTGELDQVWDALTGRFGAESVCLVPLGLDPWHDTGQIPQQQRAGRYMAMDRYFAAAWPAGATMMRNTCSIQVNLEAGLGACREERWLAANLLSPLLTAIFASSPGPGGEKSARAVTWQQMDATRTGFPKWGGGTEADPLRDASVRALGAHVMFVNRNGSAEPVAPGWRFADWVTEGHPTLGRPTRRDLESHLSTLFPEVRPRRGVLELRGIDAIPRRWWPVPVVLTAALLYDDHARGNLIEILSGNGEHLHDVWRRAAVEGLSDQQLRGAAEKLGRLAVEAAHRDTARFDPSAVSIADEYLERFTMRGLSPADELSALRADPSAALGWASPRCTATVGP